MASEKNETGNVDVSPEIIYQDVSSFQELTDLKELEAEAIKLEEESNNELIDNFKDSWLRMDEMKAMSNMDDQMEQLHIDNTTLRITIGELIKKVDSLEAKIDILINQQAQSSKSS